MPKKDSKSSKPSFFTRTHTGGRDDVKVQITDQWLVEAAHILEAVLELKGYVSFYTSRDGSAVGMQIRFGDDSIKLWQSPKDGNVAMFAEFWRKFLGEEPAYRDFMLIDEPGDGKHEES